MYMAESDRLGLGGGVGVGHSEKWLCSSRQWKEESSSLLVYWFFRSSLWAMAPLHPSVSVLPNVDACPWGWVHLAVKNAVTFILPFDYCFWSSATWSCGCVDQYRLISFYSGRRRLHKKQMTDANFCSKDPPRMLSATRLEPREQAWILTPDLILLFFRSPPMTVPKRARSALQVGGRGWGWGMEGGGVGQGVNISLQFPWPFW